MKPVIRISQGAKKYSALLDGAVPLLGSCWRDGALHFEIEGDPVPPVRPDRKEPRAPGKDAPRGAARTIVLEQGAQAMLDRLDGHRIRLVHAGEDEEAARGAVLAAAAEEGSPIAGDNQTLALLTLTQRLGASDIPVLIGGPSGTGKEVFARFLHRTSARRNGPFVAINCAAMPEAMLEALLFGHKKGAFTGAGEAAEGFFRAAHKGTLLLDEIGEMPLALQAKLLRTLQEGEVLPLGTTKPVRVDVRIVACTNRELAREVEQGRFREDLFYRLSVFPMHLPALRERPGDLAPLAFGMLWRHACRKGLPGWIATDALALLSRHHWPGNVRELENVIRRAILLAGDHPQIEAQHIRFDRAVRSISKEETDQPDCVAEASLPDNTSLSDIAFRSEARAILEALESCGGHRAKTAEALGISERTLRYRMADMRGAGLLKAGAWR